MARLSRRFSRYFSLSRRARSPAPPKMHKSLISKPIIPSDDDTHHLLNENGHTRTPSHASSAHTLSDTDPHSSPEQQSLQRDLENDIVSIIAAYEDAPPAPKKSLASTPTPTPAPSSPPSPPTAAPPTAPSPSSTYSSPPPSPPLVPTLRARLATFRDTPPPPPGWDRVCFKRETVLFGPEAGVWGMGCEGVVVMEGRAGRRKDWRGEFGRRGYGVL